MRQAIAGLIGRAFLLAILICASPAQAHEEWIGGKRVDPITRSLCCDASDTRLADDIVKSAAAGVWFSDRPGEVVPFSRIQPSPDGHWWRSVWGGEIKCVFGPFSY